MEVARANSSPLGRARDLCAFDLMLEDYIWVGQMMLIDWRGGLGSWHESCGNRSPRCLLPLLDRRHSWWRL